MCIKCKLSSDGATLVTRNANDTLVLPVMEYGRIWVWRESGGRQSILCWCVLAGISFLSPWKFSYLICVQRNVVHVVIFNATCKDNATINFNIIKYKKGQIPSILTGEAMLVTATVILRRTFLCQIWTWRRRSSECWLSTLRMLRRLSKEVFINNLGGCYIVNCCSIIWYWKFYGVGSTNMFGEFFLPFSSESFVFPPAT